MIAQPKIYVAGHQGMVGSAIVRALRQLGQTNIVTRTHPELDLCEQAVVRAFFAAEKPAAALGMQIRWEGTGINEVGYWDLKPIIRIDPRYFRPTEVETLLGDPRKAKEKLGWVPVITLDQTVQEMVAADLADAKKHALLKKHGYQISVSVE